MDYTTSRSIQQPVGLSLKKSQNMTLEAIQSYNTSTTEIEVDGVDILHKIGIESDEDQFKSPSSEGEPANGYPDPNSHAANPAGEVERLKIQIKERDLIIKVFQQMQQKDTESPEVVEASLRTDAEPPLSISSRSASTRGTRFTRSSAQFSQYGSAWPQSLDRTMNNGFGAGAPRQKEFRRDREGRERGVGLPFILGVGRTGKAPAPVPPTMLTALGVQTTDLESESEMDSISDQVEVDEKYAQVEGEEEATMLPIADAIMDVQHEDQLEGCSELRDTEGDLKGDINTEMRPKQDEVDAPTIDLYSYADSHEVGHLHFIIPSKNLIAYSFSTSTSCLRVLSAVSSQAEKNNWPSLRGLSRTTNHSSQLRCRNDS